MRQARLLLALPVDPAKHDRNNLLDYMLRAVVVASSHPAFGCRYVHTEWCIRISGSRGSNKSLILILDVHDDDQRPPTQAQAPRGMILERRCWRGRGRCTEIHVLPSNAIRPGTHSTCGWHERLRLLLLLQTTCPFSVPLQVAVCRAAWQA